MLDLSKECKFARIFNAQGAGTTTLTSSAFDLQGQSQAGLAGAAANAKTGFDAVCIVIAVGTATATTVLTINVQDCATSGGSYNNCTASYADFATLNSANATVTQQSTNAGLVVTDVGGNLSNQLIVLDVALVQLEFIKVVIARATANCAIDGVVGIFYRSKGRPVVHDTTVAVTGYFVASS
jgi:hypothetical protein